MNLDPRRIEVMDDRVAEIMRNKSPDERLTIAHKAWRFVQGLTADAVRSQHPQWSENEVAREVARRMSGGAI